MTSETAMNPFKRLVFSSAALLPLLLARCVTHAPMSEMVIFHSPATHPAFESRHGFGVGITVSPFLPTAEGLASLRYPSEIGMHAYNPNQFGVGWYTTNFDRKGRIALSLTLGALVAGLDGTVLLWRGNYLTAAVSVPGQVQIFLQHLAFNTPNEGAAVGLGVRTDVYIFDNPDGVMFSLASQRLTSLGVRSYLIYKARGDERSGVKVGLYTGYAPAIRQPMLDLSLIFGKF